jgi:hypothetical protein
MQKAVKPERLIPQFIFCPKCGSEIQIELITDPFRVQQFRKEGFDEAGRGSCKCGVRLGIWHRPLPESPTFTILVDVYQVGQ